MSAELFYPHAPSESGKKNGGVFLAIVGPSGAGKDTLIAHARDAFAGDGRVLFVRRAITRPCDGATEDHDTLAVAEFEEAEAGGAFAISWQAHGLHYGLPASLDAAIAAGGVAVANVSRGVIPALRARYAAVTVVEITAAPEVLAARLAGRGRESRGEVLARLARAVPCDTAPGTITLDNGGDKSIAGDRLVEIIGQALAQGAVAA